jgi:lipoyl(octanoyl) transferase
MLPKAIAYKRLQGFIPYQAGLELQQLITRRIMDQKAFNSQKDTTDLVLLLEHRPVYTSGRRMKGADEIDGQRLREETGADFMEVCFVWFVVSIGCFLMWTALIL